MQMASWLSNEQLSRAHNLYLVLSGLSQVSLSSLSLSLLSEHREPKTLRLVTTNFTLDSHLYSEPDLTAMMLVLADDLPVLAPGLVLRLVRQRDALLAPGGAVTSICNAD